MKICGYLRQEDICIDLAGRTKEQILAELVSCLVSNRPALDRETILRILLERERLGSTGIGDGVAIPHGKVPGLDAPLLAVGRSVAGVNFNSLDERPVMIFFLLIVPEEAPGLHLKLLARISRLLKDPSLRKGILEGADAAAIHEIILEQDNRY
jgi:PTS system nitrogen regulatory IIA component